jgi:hypothetical protein
MTLAIGTYIAYILFSASLTIWVGRTLHKAGRIFILEGFNGDAAAADSVNHLLLVGFYLVNFGFVSLFMSHGTPPTTFQEGMEYISIKVGIVLVVLGMMHFFNMRNISNMRSKARAKKEAA